jgi:hypothetical protein
MKMIEAKSISDKFWILKDSNGKIGEVNLSDNGYIVNINGNHSIFKSLETLKIETGIKFNHSVSPIPIDNESTLYGYPCNGERHNEVWNLKLKLPLFTKREDSKSWFVAGYFLLKIKNKWRTILSPKLLIMERNEFKGPFKTMEELESCLKSTNSPHINTHINTQVKLSYKPTSPLDKWFN